MNGKIFNVFCMKNRDFATATTEDDMMKTSSLSNHQTTKRPNYQTMLARWVAVAAVAAGERVEGAREGETRLQAEVA